jgi:glutamine amidotransferase
MITIIDYGMGNLRSVQKAFERLGYPADITGEPQRVGQAEKLILPGVGAFGDGMRGLRERELVEPIQDSVKRETPFLGICLGLHLLFTTGLEDGEHEGLGILAGQVVRFGTVAGLKVPHMGWNSLRIRQPEPLFAGIEDGSYFYFVHSYYAAPEDPAVVAAEACYPDPFTAAIARGRLFGTQFHPEKSQRLGLRVLRNFAEI